MPTTPAFRWSRIHVAYTLALNRRVGPSADDGGKRGSSPRGRFLASARKVLLIAVIDVGLSTATETPPFSPRDAPRRVSAERASPRYGRRRRGETECDGRRRVQERAVEVGSGTDGVAEHAIARFRACRSGALGRVRRWPRVPGRREVTPRRRPSRSDTRRLVKRAPRRP